jgi:hypothetical protein
MNRQHYLDAINTVLAWDLPEEAIANAIQYQSTTLEDQDDWQRYSIQSESFH